MTSCNKNGECLIQCECECYNEETNKYNNVCTCGHREHNGYCPSICCIPIECRNYKKKEKIMKNEKIYNTYTAFLTEYQEYFLDNETQWTNNLDKVKEYINKNKKQPSTVNNNKEIKTLCSWLSHQQTNYKKKTEIMKNEKIYNTYTAFLTEYQEYFLDNETQWENNLNKVKEYIQNLNTH